MLSVRDWSDVDRALEEMGLLDLGISELSSPWGENSTNSRRVLRGTCGAFTGKRRGIERRPVLLPSQ